MSKEALGVRLELEMLESESYAGGKMSICILVLQQ